MYIEAGTPENHLKHRTPAVIHAGLFATAFSLEQNANLSFKLTLQRAIVHSDSFT